MKIIGTVHATPFWFLSHLSLSLFPERSQRRLFRTVVAATIDSSLFQIFYGYVFVAYVHAR